MHLYFVCTHQTNLITARGSQSPIYTYAKNNMFPAFTASCTTADSLRIRAASDQHSSHLRSSVSQDWNFKLFNLICLVRGQLWVHFVDLIASLLPSSEPLLLCWVFTRRLSSPACGASEPSTPSSHLPQHNRQNIKMSSSQLLKAHWGAISGPFCQWEIIIHSCKIEEQEELCFLRKYN